MWTKECQSQHLGKREGDLNSSTRQANRHYYSQPRRCTENQNKDIILIISLWNAKVGSETALGNGKNLTDVHNEAGDRLLIGYYSSTQKI